MPSKATAAKLWREANPRAVRRYNERRRAAYQWLTAADREKTCPDCGVEFTAANANVLRCPPCKKAVLRARDAAKKRRKRARVPCCGRVAATSRQRAAPGSNNRPSRSVAALHASWAVLPS
jgi:hypothetical protein